MLEDQATGSRKRRPPTCSSMRTTRWIGCLGGRRLSKGPKRKTSLFFCQSVTPHVTGETCCYTACRGRAGVACGGPGWVVAIIITYLVSISVSFPFLFHLCMSWDCIDYRLYRWASAFMVSRARLQWSTGCPSSTVHCSATQAVSVMY